MFSYIRSFFLPNDNKFCYVVGSFAVTAPNLRTSESDIDIVCSEKMSQCEIRHYLHNKYPHLPNDIPIDVHFGIPENGVVKYKICYWQHSNDHIMLRGCRGVRLLGVRDLPDLPSVVRDPNKEALFTYLNDYDDINVGHPVHLKKSINKHYGMDDFNDALMRSKLSHDDKSKIMGLLNE